MMIAVLVFVVLLAVSVLVCVLLTGAMRDPGIQLLEPETLEEAAARRAQMHKDRYEEAKREAIRGRQTWATHHPDGPAYDDVCVDEFTGKL